MISTVKHKALTSINPSENGFSRTVIAITSIESTMLNPEIQEVDVLIAGSGSAGLAAATWLSTYHISPSRVAILDKRSGPLTHGQADGVQCRTTEIFEAFGISETLLKEGHHILEVAFWRDDGDGEGLVRRRRTEDTQRDLSWQPHIILNQARINKLMLEKMREEGGLGVTYGWEVKDVEMGEGGKWVRVVAQNVDDGSRREWRARYVLACDGAHSNVRRSLGYKMLGDSTDAVWGVMDMYPQTNFPDVRKKATLHSEGGVLLVIPREGGSLCRFYIEMPEGTKAKDVTLDDLQRVAKKMFGKYDLEFAETYWWSAYAIGQRLADHFSKDNRIFLTGDACHTHSPKAGQGMNVSLQDGYNIGWKLGMILTGQADPSLLQTYDTERGRVAKDLIDFDRNWTKMFNPRYAKEVGGGDPEYFANEFIKAGKYTAGVTARYIDTVITDNQSSNAELASNATVGMRCPSAQVVRLCDAKAMQLAQAMRSDGRWRIVIFAGNITEKAKEERLNKVRWAMCLVDDADMTSVARRISRLTQRTGANSHA